METKLRQRATDTSEQRQRRQPPHDEIGLVARVDSERLVAATRDKNDAVLIALPKVVRWESAPNYLGRLTNRRRLPERRRLP